MHSTVEDGDGPTDTVMVGGGDDGDDWGSNTPAIRPCIIERRYKMTQ